MSYQEQTTQNQTVADNVDERLATHDLFDTLKADPSLSRFAAAVEGTQLESILHGPNLLTVLATPADALSGDAADAVRNHILRGAYTEAELRRSPQIKTLDGKPLAISVEGGELRVDGVRIQRSDIECTNGVIHVVDGVINA
jgi:uncharacterized surface protein with fasciclin (FAS1) repeats